MDNQSLTEITSHRNTVMSSREIAELTGKRHADVLRDTDRLIESLNADLRLGFKSTTYKDATGKENRMYLMDRDSSVCLVSGYDANSRMRIIKRWQELEAQQAPRIPQTYAEALQLAADQAKQLEYQSRQLEQQDREIEAAKPMVQFHEEITQLDGEFTIDSACAILFNSSIKNKEFREWLKANSWMCKNVNRPTKWAMENQYMRLRIDQRNRMIFQVPIITPVGFRLLRHMMKANDLFIVTVPMMCRQEPSEYRV